MTMRSRCIARVHKLLTGYFGVDESRDDVHIPVSPPGEVKNEIMEHVEVEEVAQANIEFELKFRHLETEYWEKRAMDSFQDDSTWNLIDYTRIIEDADSTDFYWNPPSACMDVDPSPPAVLSSEKGCTRKRARNESCSSGPASKACREKVRRDKMNDRHVLL
ncbi:hypothetical protein GIB67_039567 [Kingdonia uniflora]|uniref:Uncharacterized protein n=1 Tax=Kingdonia uniflora TaxID=39325 RepID=A0A7J7P6E8_9MAGN|nr:hypothetical protein GIB67_039567 [Kingdonia uniflora]